jgi:hypothetical protein
LCVLEASRWMGRLITAFRAFFRVLFHAQTAQRVEEVLSGVASMPAPVATAPLPAPPKPVEPPTPRQNPAVALLAALQREARLIDFLREDLTAYSDEQIGAAVREVHRDAAKTLDRVFGLQPVLAEAEGASIDVPAGFDAGRFRLTGKVAGNAPFRGALRHHGWEATRCDLPTYTGSTAAALTIAPAEVEVA